MTDVQELRKGTRVTYRLLCDDSVHTGVVEFVSRSRIPSAIVIRVAVPDGVAWIYPFGQGDSHGDCQIITADENNGKDRTDVCEFDKARSLKYAGLVEELRFWIADDNKDVETAINNLEDVLKRNNYINGGE